MFCSGILSAPVLAKMRQPDLSSLFNENGQNWPLLRAKRRVIGRTARGDSKHHSPGGKEAIPNFPSKHGIVNIREGVEMTGRLTNVSPPGSRVDRESERNDMARVCNLLIADGDFDQVILIESLLNTLGKPHQCHQTASGYLTLQFLQKLAPYEDAPRPDLILLDLNLPEGNGAEVLREIKSHPDLRSIPVIIVSACRNEVDVNACYNQYANAFISKAGDLAGAVRVVSAIEQFWLQTAELPTRV